MVALTWFTFTFLLFGMLIMVMSSTKFIRQGSVGIIERMGKYVKTVGPGVHFITPIFSRMIGVSIKLQMDHYPPQKIVTKDQLEVKVDAVLFYHVIDAKRAIYDVEDYKDTVEKHAISVLKFKVSSMTLNECMTHREAIRNALQETLDEITGRFGVKVSSVEIQTVEPNEDIIRRMEELKTADIYAAAVRTRADGDRDAAIARAEGEKQAAIKKAQGEGEALETRARGEREASILQAEGRALAYTSLFTALNKSGISEEIIAIRYLEALEKVSQGEATTLILPYESTSLLGAIAGIAKTMAAGNGGNGDPVKKATEMIMEKPPIVPPEITPDA